MILDIKKDNLSRNFEKIGNSLYLTSNNTVIKNCLESKNQSLNIVSNLEYVYSIPRIEGYTYPINLVRDENIYGYEMEYLKGYISLYDYLRNYKYMDFDVKKKICLGLFNTLRRLNEYYIVGDINNGNIMFNNEGYFRIIDWENGISNSSDENIFCLYKIGYVQSLNIQDIIKLFICSVSLLYDIDLERETIGYTIFNLRDNLIDLNIDKRIINYLDEVINDVINRNNKTIYFDEYLKDIRNIRHYDKVRRLYSK